MQRLALATLSLILLSCADHERFITSFTSTPGADSVNVRRVMGEEVMVAPLTPEPGDIWADLPTGHMLAVPAATAQRALSPAGPAADRAVMLGNSSPVTQPSQATAAAQPPRHFYVQLTAANSETAARAEWRRLEQHLPQLILGRIPNVMQSDTDGRLIWRLRTGGFADHDEANAFCARMQAEHGNCWVVTGAS